MIIKLLLIASVLITGCAGLSPPWPRPELAPGAENIKVLNSTKEAVGCKRVGAIAGHTTHAVGGIRRDPKIVKEDIYVTAKNGTFFADGDTMAPVGRIEAGMQNFVAYKCNRS